MNNGLRGRYLEQLQAWNHARTVAAVLVQAFHENKLRRAIDHLDVSIPSMSDLKKLLNNSVFLDGHSTINTVARGVMEWQ